MRTTKSYISGCIRAHDEPEKLHKRSDMGSIEEGLEGLQDRQDTERRKEDERVRNKNKNPAGRVRGQEIRVS